MLSLFIFLNLLVGKHSIEQKIKKNLIFFKKLMKFWKMYAIIILLKKGGLVYG